MAIRVNDLRLQLVFDAKGNPSLTVVNSTLYDLMLLHELIVLVTSPDYRDVSISRFFWFRGGRRLASSDRLRVSKLSLGSPLVIELLLGGSLLAGSAWALVQTTEKIRNWRLNRQILQEQLRQARVRRQIDEQELDRLLRERGAQDTLASLVRRLEGDLPAIDGGFVRGEDEE